MIRNKCFFDNIRHPSGLKPTRFLKSDKTIKISTHNLKLQDVLELSHNYRHYKQLLKESQ